MLKTLKHNSHYKKFMYFCIAILNFIIMTFEEFSNQQEHVFNIGCVSFHYYKLAYNLWSLCITIPTERKEWYFEVVRPSSTMSCFDAFTSYNNLFNSLNKLHE